GRPYEELYTRPDAWQEGIHPDDRAHAAQLYSRWVGGDPSVEYSIEYRVVRPDGAIRWIHDRGVRIRNEQGAVTRVMGVAEDITDRRLAHDTVLRQQRMFEPGPVLALRWLLPPPPAHNAYVRF